ncbi:unnamed protein product [Phyllotreta striolata]|uniref:Uncharacterized protein n=1 Tax=Phyllotreta striolata TaxID=444603 RepID=A0A9N9XS44_PHYSR|nr:unnamed protein product [Phyllotreta striolata]
MDFKMVPRFFYIVTLLTISEIVLANADIDQLKHSEDLDPLNDTDNADNSEKEQEKRTIFNPTLKNVAWAKHVAVNPAGAKVVLGYGPVDFKYKPVLRPIAIKHQGYHYNRPRIHFHLKRPAVHIPHIKPVIQSEWKPIVKPVAVVKPAPVPVPVHVHPGAHVDQLHLNPVPHIDHVHKEPLVHLAHSHVHHVPTTHLHPVSLPHVHAAPLVPTTQLFEVTKPDLGVLPLGAAFPTTVLKEVPPPQLVPHNPLHLHPLAVAAPGAHLHPVLPPIQPVVAPQPIAAPIHPHIHPFVPAPAVLPIQPAHVNVVPHFHSPGHVFPLGPLPVGQDPDHIHHGNHVHPVGHTDIYHGDHVDHVPQPHLYHEQSLLPNHYHLQYPQIPQHPVQEIPNAYPHHHHQSFPLDSGQNSYHPLQQEGNVQDQYPYQEENHYQDANQVSSQQFYREGQYQFGEQADHQGYVYQQPSQGRLIQPGHTDVQFPLHLPHHPAFDHDNRPEASRNDEVFRPSVQLEPPYKK